MALGSMTHASHIPLLFLAGSSCFDRYAQFKPAPLSSPAGAGEDEAGGLSGLNRLKSLNLKI
jgi:hypothetical protein